jgi:hypothetical protein
VDVKFTPITNAIAELYSRYSENLNLIDKEKLLYDK